MSKHVVQVSNGKYTFRIEPGPTMFIDRGGVYWHAQQEAFNALHSIMCELDAARVVVDACRKLAEHMGKATPTIVQLALEKHRALVDDRQRPSEWAGEVTS